MFSFHKPKIYRSLLGCCICKAKSSSSRFTDSKKYEAEFERCFKIQEKRSGEICNACVLLVKRWKKLSPENRCVKNWHHVVDARAGPGTKSSLSKQQQNQRQQNGQQSSIVSMSRENRSTTGSGRQSKSNANKMTYLSSSKFEANRHCEEGEDEEDELKSSLSKRFGPKKASNLSNINKQLLTANNNNTSKYNDIILNRYKRTPTTDVDVYTDCVMTNTSHSNNIDDDNDDDLDIDNNNSRNINNRSKRKPLYSCRYRSGGGDVSNIEEHSAIQKQQLRFSSRMAKKASYSNSWSNAPSSSQQQLSETSSQQQQFRPNNESICGTVLTTTNNISSRSRRKSSDSSKITSFLDMALWKKEKICCGIIFRGLNDEVAIFPKLLRPCSCRLKEMMSSSSSSNNKQDTTSSNSVGESSMSSSSLSDSISTTSSNDDNSSNISGSINATETGQTSDDLSMIAESSSSSQKTTDPLQSANINSDAISTTSSFNSMMLVEDSDSYNSDSIGSTSPKITSHLVASTNLSVNNGNDGANSNATNSNLNVTAH